MKKDWKYIFYLGGAVMIYVAFNLLAPRQLDWRVTYYHKHKIPFGGYALNTLVHDQFSDRDIVQNNETLYELYDSVHTPMNLLIVASSFSPGDEEVQAMLGNVALGGHALLSVGSLYGKLSDTLGIDITNYFYEDGYNQYITDTKDSTYFRFSNAGLPDTAHYIYPRKNMGERISVTNDSLDVRVAAVNDLGMAVTVTIPWGKGRIILNSTPMIFTNAYILSGENHRFAATTLSYLPDNDLLWTEFYELGRMEAQTPLRYILTTPALRWAYFITILALLLFILFEAKRRQRTIPIIKPVANTTLEFVRTIGDLYYQHGDHKDIAEKLITYWLEHVRTRYWLSTTKLDDAFTEALIRKSGKPADDVRALVNVVRLIQSRPDVALDRLIDLNDRIEKFNLS
ncbi:DUF4350 domain-containing protein [Dawidia soli]|uniref:DUF4350 domain-containing protein n=1 Tax=Dawidia soli TaxID=2782352 RepID=A0AAP2DD53_9BACT|nr:DUF4350 domain-containing protein [Dawidia soli]MBT1687207.1 hypothetical protein [Dawidia soli]